MAWSEKTCADVAELKNVYPTHTNKKGTVLQMPALKTYDLFISHAWTYDAEYFRVVKFLNEAPNFQWRNYSVPEHDPVDANSTRRLEEALRRQMRPVNATLIVSGMYAAHRDWIQFEIDFSSALAKPIIGIVPWGGERIPKVFQDSAVIMVRWNQSPIINAIRRFAI